MARMATSRRRKSDRSDDEAARMRRLQEYDVIGTGPECEFDEIARLAADALEAPIALLCLTESSRHWFKSHIGTDLTEVPREVSFCDYTMRQRGVLVVPDATLDERFAHYPLVTGGMCVRFYAGTSLVAPDGHLLGTLCVCDTLPRPRITDRQTRAVESLARLAADRLELRRHQRRMQGEQERAAAAEQEARRAHERLREAIELLPEAIVFRDADKRFVLWNRRYEELYAPVADLLEPGQTLEAILRASVERGLLAEDCTDVEDWIDSRLQSPLVDRGPIEQQLRHGRWVRIEERRIGDGGIIGVHVDITDLKRREQDFRLLFEGNPMPMCVADSASLRFLAVNDAMVRHFGYGRDALLAMDLPDIHAGANLGGLAALLAADGGADPTRVWAYRGADGSEIRAVPYHQAITYRGHPALLVTLVDVTEQLAAEERMTYLAHHDVLTGLPNRATFDTCLARAVADARASGSSVGLCLVDVDHFKDINDTLGHGAGDAVLKSVGRHLRNAVRASDTVARLGGDEFAVILPNVVDDRSLDMVAQRLLRFEFAEVEGYQLPFALSASVGIARFPTDAGDAQELVQNADIALYRSKSSGRARLTVFDHDLRRRIHQRVSLKGRFRQALSSGQIKPHYQPIVDFGTGRIRGFEALARWHCPTQGILPASQFADVFEDADLSAALGLFMLEAVTDDIVSWDALGTHRVRVGLNVTAADLRRHGFVDQMIATVRRKGLEPARLLLEVTENVILDREDGLVTRALNEIAGHGIRVALDDFGTGHASLTHLKKVRASVLKIDQSFIRDIAADGDDRAIVNTVIGLGASLGMTTIAEGIETVEQAEMLKEAGCAAGQGYLFGRPVAASGIPMVVQAYEQRPWTLGPGRAARRTRAA